MGWQDYQPKAPIAMISTRSELLVCKTVWKLGADSNTTNKGNYVLLARDRDGAKVLAASNRCYSLS